MSIQNLINVTRNYFPGHIEKTLASRQPGGTGSRFLSITTESDLCGVDWEEITESLPVADRLEGCRYFKAPIPGLLGVIPLRDLSPDQLVRLEDPKSTGKVSAVINRSEAPTGLQEVDFTVLISGLEAGETVLFTVHPGLPIQASRVPAQEWAGKSVTAARALELGLTFCKLEG